ncbi:MAG: stage II sporulation protein R, partial [Bacilli bacterium]|nr:stage II sporulation protein R [Bacilli bacterium]
MFDVNDNIDTFRYKLSSNVNTFKENINEVLLKNNYELPFDINYGFNYFPQKTFKGIKYDEGYYESLVVTIGNGLGDNWWCVLFPPLCLIEAEEYSVVEYTTLVGELINKYF